MIPTSSLYPSELDSNTNLFEVHDSLRLRLIEDYKPGDTSIKVDVTDFLIASRISPTGLITLTEQCSDVDKRAVSFFYNTWDATAGIFSGLELLPTFTDVLKPKNITNVTVNVMAMHHNHLKEALIAIQKFCGTKGLEDNEPFGPTLEGRINFLRRLVLQPKAWFTSDKRNGNVPLEVEFKNMSFRLGTDGTADEVKVTWDFGDQTTSVISYISLISADSMVPDNAVDVLVRDTDGGTIKKIYHTAGIFDVQLTVENNFGKDVCVFKDFINARVKAPKEAIINFIEDTATQEATPGVPPNGPFQTIPTIRSPINTLITIEVPSGENVIGTPNYSFAGEALDENGNPLDPVISYTWQLGDDLSHPNASQTNASYSVGGIYSLKLRVDTEFGAYRITNYENALDIVENTNLWLWNINDSNIATGYEYGLISETFKLFNSPTYPVVRNESFLNSQPENLRSVMKAQFRRNTGFAPRSTVRSGNGGIAMLYWAGGRNQADPVSSEQIKMVEFDGFSGIYVSRSPINRAWNWINLNSSSNSYFAFGTVGNYPSETSPTNTTKTTLSLTDLSTSQVSFESSNYLNGSQELAENVASYDNLGDSIYGHYSVYRTAWKDSAGYILRNDGVGPFFRLKSFYRTEGTLGNNFLNIRKLLDVQGPTKLDGQLTDLSGGVYLLNNSGSVSKFDITATTWTSGGPGVNSLIYRNLQDTSVVGFDNQANTLLVVSDSDKRAYLSFDYSANAFLKFSELDLTFSSLGSRPTGTQWIMGVY
jgi:PKD repeat protein